MKRYLILADSSIFEGEAIGADGEAIGEVVFNTAMGGYMGTLTDPCYYGQLVTQTFPLIGNCGAIECEGESIQPKLSGFIVRELCGDGSNFNKQSELNEYLVKKNVIGIADIDTRCLTRHLRDNGTMNGMLCDNKTDLEKKLGRIKEYKVTDAVKNTSIAALKTVNEGNGPRVLVWDFGAHRNIENDLIKLGCTVITVPYSYTAKQIVDLKPDGIVLTGGAGDPNDNKNLIKEISLLNAYKIPTFAIGLGHQLLAISLGGKITKLKHGHRGTNQPVKNLKTNRIYMSSQNHSYCVVAKNIGGGAEVSYVNVNDHSCEGLDYSEIPAFGVQFHPEDCGGPCDTLFILDKFICAMAHTPCLGTGTVK